MAANSSATVNGNSQTVDLNGNSDTVTTTGSGDAVDVFGSAEVVGGSASTISFDGSGEQSLDATGTGDNVRIYDTGDTFTGTNDALSFSNGSETLYLYATGVTVTGQAGDTTDFGIYSSGTVTGSDQTIGLLATGENVAASGSGDVVNDFGASDVLGGSAATIGLDGGGNQALTVTNAGDSIGESGSGDSVIASGDSLFQSGVASGSQTLAVDGNNNTIGSAQNDNLTVEGNNNTVNAYYAGDVVNDAGYGTIVGGTRISIGIDGSGNQSLSTTGSGDTIGENSSGDLLTGSNETVYLAGGTASSMQTMTVDGSSNTTNAASDNVLAVNGGADTSYLAGSKDTVFVSGTTSQIDTDHYAGETGDQAMFDNLTTNTSQLQEVDPTGAASLGYFDYSSLNGGGTLENYTYDNENGTSQTTAYDPTAGVTQSTEDFTGLNDQGNETALTFQTTNGDRYDDSFVYGGSSLQDYYQTVDNSGGAEISELEFNSSGAVVEDIYGSGNYGNYNPSFSGGYGIYGDSQIAGGSAGADVSTIAAQGAGKGTGPLTGIQQLKSHAIFASKKAAAPPSASQETTPALTLDQIAAVNNAAQVRIAGMVQAMASFGAESHSLQTSIQTALQDLQQPVLAAAPHGH